MQSRLFIYCTNVKCGQRLIGHGQGQHCDTRDVCLCRTVSSAAHCGYVMDVDAMVMALNAVFAVCYCIVVVSVSVTLSIRSYRCILLVL